MLKTEGRNRSLSFTYTGSSTHMGSKILRQPDAEHLIQPFPIKEFKEENEEVDDFALPCLPSPTNPKEAKKIRILEQITSKFHLTDAHLMHIEKRMLDEVNRGLGKATNRTANVKSFVTYVHEIPSGRESGQYLALDLGGTNFRVILVELEAGSRSVKMKACKHEVRFSSCFTFTLLRVFLLHQNHQSKWIIFLAFKGFNSRLEGRPLRCTFNLCTDVFISNAHKKL